MILYFAITSYITSNKSNTKYEVVICIYLLILEKNVFVIHFKLHDKVEISMEKAVSRGCR